MNKNLWALTIAWIMLLDWWQEALASKEPINLWKSTVWETTETVKKSTDDCLKSWSILSPEGDCVIMTNLVNQSYIDSLEQKTIQNTENWKNRHNMDLLEFWWSLVSILGAISLLLSKDIILDKLKRNKIEKLQEELKDKIDYLYYEYPFWFIHKRKDEIEQIEKEWKICYESLFDEWIAPKNQKKDTLQKLQELKDKIEVLSIEFNNVNSVYKDNIQKLAILCDSTLYLIIKLREKWVKCKYSEKDINPSYNYNNIIKEIYDMEKIFNELNEIMPIPWTEPSLVEY
jgi:hypothetical protein